MKNRNLFWLITLAALWGPSFLFIKIAVVDLPPLTLVAIRLVLGAIFLFAILKISKRELPKGFQTWKKFTVMGFYANALPFALISFGEQFSDSGVASILNGTTPIFTILFAHWLLEDEKLTMNRIIGVVIGFLGILLIFYPEIGGIFSGYGTGTRQEFLGLGAIMLGAVSYGISIVYARKNLRGFPPLVGPTAQLICAAAIVLPLSLIFDKPFALRPGGPAMLSAVVLGIFGTAFAYLVYYKLVDSAGATFISFVTYLLPPIGVILGILFLGETPTLYALSGMVTIIIGIIVVNRAQRSRA